MGYIQQLKILLIKSNTFIKVFLNKNICFSINYIILFYYGNQIYLYNHLPYANKVEE
jgi:hypothetical protein